MTDPGTAALAIIAAIWARESARGNSFDRVNQIRDRILIGKIDSTDITLSHRELMYVGDWRPLATGVAAVSFLFSFVIGLLPFLLDSSGNVALTILCSAVGLYQLCDGVTSARTLFRDSKVMRKCLNDLRADASKA